MKGFDFENLDFEQGLPLVLPQVIMTVKLIMRRWWSVIDSG